MPNAFVSEVVIFMVVTLGALMLLYLIGFLTGRNISRGFAFPGVLALSSFLGYLLYPLVLGAALDGSPLTAAPWFGALVLSGTVGVWRGHAAQRPKDRTLDKIRADWQAERARGK